MDIDRTFGIILLTATTVSVVLVSFLGPLDPWVDIIPLLVFLYAAYWALAIRGSLGVSLFRKQALGIGLVALSWGSVLAAALVFGGSPSFTTGNPAYLSPYFAGALTFYWVDASMLTAKRMDPLGRNNLHWKGLRSVFWTFLLIGIVLDVLGYLFNGWDSILFTSSLPSSFFLLIILVILVIAIVFEFAFTLAGPAIMGIILLPIIARRTKDRQLQRHFLWFGSFMLFFFVVLIFLGIATSFVFIPATVAAFSLYRSARSLVPLNKISLSD